MACAAPEPAPSPTLAAPSQTAPTPAAELPIFDAHLHYSAEAWTPYPPDRALAILREAGVRGAVLSSTPDDGTLMLLERAPGVVAPFLRPYRKAGDAVSWTSDESVPAYLEERLAARRYLGIGEVHLDAPQVASSVVRRVVALAAARSLYLQVHGDDLAVEELLRAEPRLRILWAHAGVTAGPVRIERLLERNDALVVELSNRVDVAPQGTLDPAWRQLFLRFPDRFLVGTDTWINAQWERYAEIQRFERAWLAQLPRDVAERIAFRNGERLFGRR